MFFCKFQSLLGMVTLQTNNTHLIGAWFETYTTQPDDLGIENTQHPVLKQAIVQLNEYFLGKREQFDLPINFEQGTPFQQQVWQTLLTIPYGKTMSYQDIADRIGNPKSVRAVGMANGKNPLSVIVPCHRVIAKSGKLSGYAGGVERKKALLKLEKVALQE